MSWLDARPSSINIDYAFLATFEFEGNRIPLKDYSRGIRHPKGMRGALSISTTFTPPGGTPPYDDLIGSDGLQRYKYRGTDPQHPENVALRQARELGLPLIWFVAIERGTYEPIYPVWVIGEEPAHQQFTLALDAAQKFLPTGDASPADVRAYALSLTKVRLHQRAFRARVLLAYGGKCCICRLKHAELLDAAHIIADGQPNGQPVVPNGLSLCKIHHAAVGKCVPGTSEKVYLQYTFTGKLGVDGSAVEVAKSGADNYIVSVPEFDFIGYSEPTFEVVVTDGGVLSAVTEDIDQAAMITKILSGDAQQRYLDDNEATLQEQTKVFYDNIIRSVAPEAGITYEFA